MKRLAKALLAAAVVLGLGACGEPGPEAPQTGLEAVRKKGRASEDAELVGRWLMSELLMPGGTAAQTVEARRSLDRLSSKGMLAPLAKATDDDVHGRFSKAFDGYLATLSAARNDETAHAGLIAWLAASRLQRLRSSVPDGWTRARGFVEQALASPGHIGWSARSELVDLWASETIFRQPTPKGAPAPIDVAAKQHGCVTHARMAGPFGHQAATDYGVHFEAERPGPWPPSFPRDPRRLDPPRILETERVGCQFFPADAVGGGVFYIESYIDLSAEREAIVAVQGAVAVFVDDREVLTRPSDAWGIWPRFGAQLRLSAGRHRILARVAGAETSIRILAPVGTPLDVVSSDDPTPSYGERAPILLSDPNVLAPFMEASSVPPQPGVGPASREGTDDPILRYVAANLSQLEGQHDLASVLIEPLVADVGKASGPILGYQATLVEKDPIFPESDGHDLARTLRESAVEKDPELWWPTLWLVLDEAEKRGAPEVVPKLAALADRFREVPELVRGLAAVYGRLGWRAERARTIEAAAARFPEDTEILSSLLDLYDADGRTQEADAVAARIETLEPDAEVTFQRALARRDYDAAIAELQKLGERRADRRDIAIRIGDLLTRAGRKSESMDVLERDLEKDPKSGAARLAVADARFAGGDRGALRQALVDAIEQGAETASLREAIELVEGLTELDPFREDGLAIVRAYEALPEKLPGNAARVLDYAALWVHEDGSARMLEHEIIHVASREAITALAEQRVPGGLVLRMRTIKRDGRVMEPEWVSGKPTLTMPHLEVGDYIETESVGWLRGDGRGGRVFQGPRWFFREEGLSYWRSELVVVSPKSKPFDVEVGGQVPPPTVREDGALVTRRWRVDRSPALPEEPGMAPIQEFLPNVRIGWGVSLDERIAYSVDSAADLTPADPRLARVARTIAGSGDADARTRRIYRWILANVEPQNENDPRRTVIGKAGNPGEAFRYLARLAGIQVSYGLVRDRLVEAPRGPFSEAEQFSSVVMRVAKKQGAEWLIVGDKYAPYGYLPSSLRGQPAVVLVPGAPRETTSTGGARDAVVSEGQVVLAEDGSASITLDQRYEGKFAIGLRRALETIADAELPDAVESQLLSNLLPGARLEKLDVKKLEDLDEPLTLAMKIHVPSLARPGEQGLVLAPPFTMNLAALAALPTRETPLYISEGMTTHSEVRLSISLPKGARLVGDLAQFQGENQAISVVVADAFKGQTLELRRTIDLPAGRIQPEVYAEFQRFARAADAALQRDIVVQLPR